MRVKVEQDKCITSGQCVLVAPEVFDQDDDGLVILLQESPSEDLAEGVREAQALCPARLIHIAE
jgi:ferredoxin